VLVFFGVVSVHVLQVRNFQAKAGEVVRKISHMLHHTPIA